MEKIILDDFIFLIRDFFTPEACDSLMAWSERSGYKEAGIQGENGNVIVKDIRNNSRITFIDKERAESLWKFFEPFAITRFANSNVCGLNDMFRFYKYEAGQQFRKHTDESYIRSAVEASYFTLMIYLNDDFEGGETRFREHVVRPEKGTALVFYHSMEHAGEPVIRGTKYVLRTDVMYKLIE
jgi:prolyl 4-hydroxylase